MAAPELKFREFDPFNPTPCRGPSGLERALRSVQVAGALLAVLFFADLSLRAADGVAFQMASSVVAAFETVEDASAGQRWRPAQGEQPTSLTGD